ncbi:hypothetical protein G6L63_13315 [Agrobacterium vitis]|uniref:Uncharacterized protein n=1 Tax=Agrobacterium vitis TaxID=373 RepID=A0A368NNP1_AGRVI|nr:hypothetical protein [Agrobacterium vitis]KAA3516877.1 hypothetical protein DXM22_10405 [Agrobacterium vitis]KAA3529642.1 hypothetical protein DXT89_07930 [Agrobacterium vitis]MCF1477351.1 hypothetical protein [Agrobacterium vitis]MUZ97500.1 hypothetical protein [Agrobacterium vitis]MVA28083.1 hypothetical protein [Agrobacterium vitis]
MADTSKTVKRQPFGPNETDINLCYFVCFDSELPTDGDVAERWVHFNDNDDALAYFADKSKDASLFVWKGELAIAKGDGQFDWFFTQWSKSLEKQLTQKSAKGMGYRFSNDAFEAFEPLEFEEEEAE